MRRAPLDPPAAALGGDERGRFSADSTWSTPPWYALGVSPGCWGSRCFGRAGPIGWGPCRAHVGTASRSRLGDPERLVESGAPGTCAQ